jgi:hypothetical protein
MDAAGAVQLGLRLLMSLCLVLRILMFASLASQRLVLLLADLIGRKFLCATAAPFTPTSPPVWQGARFDDEHGKGAADRAGAREGITRPGNLNVRLH